MPTFWSRFLEFCTQVRYTKTVTVEARSDTGLSTETESRRLRLVFFFLSEKKTVVGLTRGEICKNLTGNRRWLWGRPNPAETANPDRRGLWGLHRQEIPGPGPPQNRQGAGGLQAVGSPFGRALIRAQKGFGPCSRTRHRENRLH